MITFVLPVRVKGATSACEWPEYPCPHDDYVRVTSACAWPEHACPYGDGDAAMVPGHASGRCRFTVSLQLGFRVSGLLKPEPVALTPY